jgi:hypothetical protein
MLLKRREGRLRPTTPVPWGRYDPGSPTAAEKKTSVEAAGAIGKPSAPDQKM